MEVHRYKSLGRESDDVSNLGKGWIPDRQEEKVVFLLACKVEEKFMELPSSQYFIKRTIPVYQVN